ncbi:MAG: hypothetical protein AAGG81_06135 [Chlamydiota bacterium]
MGIFRRPTLTSICGHLMGCTAAKITYLVYCQKIAEDYEYAADEYAAKKSPEIAHGEVEMLQRLQKYNLESLDNYEHELEKRKGENPTVLTRVHSSVCSFLYGLLITKEGDLRWFMMDPHPTSTDRIRKIRDLIPTPQVSDVG